MKNADVIVNFGTHLRKLRERRDFSQQELADSANIAKKTVQRIENAKLNPSLDTLASLSKAFDMPLKDLMDF